MDWHFFDKIYCISLEERQDRRDKLNPIFEKYNIPVEYFIAQRCPFGGIQGCYESHIELLSRSFEKGYDNIIIFEDDIVDHPEGFNQGNLNEVINFLCSNKKWEIFYLGVVPEMTLKSKRVGNNIYNVRGWCTHAYVASRRLMQKFYLSSYATSEIDAMFTRTHHAYSIYPSFFYQRSGDISDLRDGNDWPMKEVGTRMIEHYSYKVNINPIFLVTLILILVFLLSFICKLSGLSYYRSIIFITYVLILLLVFFIILG